MNAAFGEYFHRIRILIRKELLAILKDPASRIVLIAPVLIQTLLFGYAATFDLRRIDYALLDQDGSGASVELAARFDATGVFRRVATLGSPAQIAGVIDSGDALVVIHVGQGFERQLEAGGQAPIQVIIDARNSNTAGSAAGYVNSVVELFNTRWRENRGAPPPALRIEQRAWFNPNLETRWYFLPGMIASLSMLQTLLLTALSVAREREQGTFDQLLVTPLTPTQIMVGKAVPPMLIGIVQATLVLLICLFWFRIPMAGSLLLLYAGLVSFTAASVGLGLAISAVARNMQQAMFYAFVLVMPLMLLSGLTTPISNMPQALQVATLVNPLRFGIHLVQRVYLEGAGFLTVWHDLIPMVLIAAVTLPLASWLFRHRLV